MRWCVSVLAMVSLCGSGCSKSDISSDGKVLHVVVCRPKQGTPDKALRKVEGAIADIPAKAPAIERLERGRIDAQGDFPGCLYLMVLFNDAQSAFEPAYQQALEDAGEAGRLDKKAPRITMGNARTYLLHDATPDVRTSTHGRLRRVVFARLDSDTTADEMQEFEDVVAALPSKIPSIERLEWGASTGYNPAEPGPTDPSYRDGSYILLFTFANARQRDACLASPAYKDFQEILRTHATSQFAESAFEYAAIVEYVAQN